ncbi:metallophosphoesterase [Virgibacillus sediminis]|uniref:Metallophosphoesterase n=1 Tax=Virgibacillus sediminis TaxID=202260 RepID=A0ABV7A4J2_9BACI
MYLLTAAILIGVIALLYSGYRNTKSVQINQINLEKIEREKADQEKTDQEKTKPLRILHLSDIHLENLSITPQELYNYINKQHIDLIALTGDFLDRKRSIKRLAPYLEVIGKINPKYGTYANFGNHDYVLKEEPFRRLKQMLIDYGIHTLQNENKAIDINGISLNIIGIDDYGTGRSNLSKSYEGLQNGYNLVLTHDPNVVLEMEEYHFNYLLAGHFHGGQIHWPKPYHLVKMGKLVRMDMVKGMQYFRGRPFYISEGLGQTGVNIRFGSRPEITFHQIELPVEETQAVETRKDVGARLDKHSAAS